MEVKEWGEMEGRGRDGSLSGLDGGEREERNKNEVRKKGKEGWKI